MAANGKGTNRLAQMLYLWRTVNRLSLRDLERETGIPHATLMRIEHGHVCDLKTWQTLVDWMLETVGPAPRKRAEVEPDPPVVKGGR